MYTMKQTCEEVGMNYETLKFYCNEGLIPNVKRNKNNHRIFDEIGLITENTNIHTDKLGQIPILTKEIIRQEGENLYSDELNKRGAYENTSGGSTGEPVRFMQDKVYFAIFHTSDFADSNLKG